ncbi:MAG TPA: hypothetical protein VGL40_15375 [Bacillota bacterium]
MNELSTIYARFDSRVEYSEGLLTSALNQARELGAETLRIVGNAEQYEKAMIALVTRAVSLGIRVWFDLDLGGLSDQFIGSLEPHAGSVVLAVNIDEVSDRRIPSVGGQPPVVNVTANRGNAALLTEFMGRLLSDRRIGLLKVSAHIREIGSIDLYLKLARDLISLHRSYPGQVYAMMPWCLLEISELRLGRTICQYQSTVGVFPDGAVTACGVSRTAWEPVSRLSECSLRQAVGNDPLLRNLRSLRPSGLEGVCSICIFRDYCGNLCPARVFNITRSFSKSFDDCQILYDNGLFPPAFIRDGV